MEIFLFTLREAIDTQNLFLLNSKAIGCQLRSKRGNFISKIFFACGRQKTSRPVQKANRRATTAKSVRKMMRKKKNKKERERERKENHRTHVW